MKKILMFCCFATAFSCQEDISADQANPCTADIDCTREFRIINLEIVDQNGDPVIFDDYFTEFEDFNVKVQKDEFKIQDGFYPVASDGEMDQLDFEGKKAIFRVLRNGTPIIKHEMVIAKDCCHVLLISGEDKIVFNQ